MRRVKRAAEEKHLWDYVRVLYRTRWVTVPAFLIVFVPMTINTLRQAPRFQAVTQILIEEIAPADQTSQAHGGYTDGLLQTQLRILESRSLAKRAIDLLDPSTVEQSSEAESPVQSARISEFLAGLSVTPVKNTRIAQIRYTAGDPVLAAAAANSIAAAYVQQNLEWATGNSGERRPPTVRVLDGAQAPRRQASPNVAKDLTLAFVAGLVFALGLAFGVEYLDTRIRTPQALKATLAIPFLGMVPSLAHVKSAPSNPLLNDGVPQNFSEAFKTVRTNVLFSSMEEGLRTLVITSAGPAEGKSLVASNLAIAMAQASQRVLLIDADMRRPRIHEIFGGEQEPGLSNLLQGSAEISQAVRTSAIPGLWLMHAGYMPANPAELLGSRQYADVIASLGEHFDWVVLDTPPVLVVADSSIVANQSSGVVFVVDADSTTRQAARAAVEQLDSAHAHVIGAVLNKVDLIRNPYYYSPHYRQDYGRHYVSAAAPRANL